MEALTQHIAHEVQRPQILRLPQVCQVTGVCRSMIYQLEAARRIPNRVKLGLRAVGWIENGEWTDSIAEYSATFFELVLVDFAASVPLLQNIER